MDKTTRIINERYIDRYLKLADQCNVGCLAHTCKLGDWKVTLTGDYSDFIKLDTLYVDSFKTL